MSKSRILAACLAVFLVSAVGLAAPARAADPEPPVRIMVNGDSISQGFDGDVNWRYFFWKELQRQRLSVDMVGPTRTPYVLPGWPSAAYADPNFDTDHDAAGGSLLRNWRSKIGADVAAFHPDVLVVELGVNDLRARTSPADLFGFLQAYVAAVRTADPSVDVVVSPVLPIVDPTRRWIGAAIAQYDALLTRGVPAMNTTEWPESRVTLAPTTRGWNASRMTWDGVHPAPLGASVIAQRLAEALYSSRAVPAMRWPSVPVVSTWYRNAVAQVRIVRSRAVVRWDNQTINSARVLVRRVGRGGKVKWHRVYAVRVYGPSAVLRTHRLSKGDYEIRVSVTRRAMTSAYGPATKVHVGRHRG